MSNDDGKRTTIDLPADLHHAVTSIAAHARKGMNRTTAELIRRGLANSPLAAEFRPDMLSYDQALWHGVMGHRQVTDAFLASLARRRRLVDVRGGGW